MGIIMDGNRRWAKKKGFLPWLGHKKGFKKLEEVVEWAAETGITNLIVFAFSTENWRRSRREISEIIKILNIGLTKKVSVLTERGARVSFMGNRSDFDKKTKALMEKAENIRPKKEKINLVVALSYGGRDEIIRAAEQTMKKKIKMSEKHLSENLDTENMPDPDLIIRTGGEMRLSNFLLWQSAYSELFFTQTLWPDFSKREFLEIIDEYKKRERRNGK